jgi:hypothetical protein
MRFSNKLHVNISHICKENDLEYAAEHTYNSCKDNDMVPQNAYYNGCPRCVALSIAIAEAAIQEFDIVYEEE